MNYKSEDMIGVVSPTDSRFRDDTRLYEEGYIDESENAKNKIENL
jgi:hypothetical protein